MVRPRPEDDAAQWRRSRGISRVEGVPRDDRLNPHPSCGGTRGYPIVFCQKLIFDYQNGRPVLCSMVRSIQRWLHRVVPFRMTGNIPQRGLCGEHLLLLVLNKLV